MEKIDQAILKKELAEAKTESEGWLSRVLQTVDSGLMKNPNSYKDYGPYWWNLKKMLALYMINDIGSYSGDIEIDTANKFAYDSDELNIAAAIIYCYNRGNYEIMGTATHGDGYIIHDPEMEEISQISAMTKLPNSVLVV